MLFLALYIFARLFWRARETLVKQPPGESLTLISSQTIIIITTITTTTTTIIIIINTITIIIIFVVTVVVVIIIIIIITSSPPPKAIFVGTNLKRQFDFMTKPLQIQGVSNSEALSTLSIYNPITLKYEIVKDNST